MKRRVLIVSEDPEFIASAQESVRGSDVQVIACLGPTHGRCDLYEDGACRLLPAVDSVLVDAPESGEFRYHVDRVTAGKYAEDLQRAHPSAHVYLCGIREGMAGPTGDVTVLADRGVARELLLN